MSSFIGFLTNDQSKAAERFLDWLEEEDGDGFLAGDEVAKETFLRKWGEWKRTTKTNT